MDQFPTGSCCWVFVGLEFTKFGVPSLCSMRIEIIFEPTSYSLHPYLFELLYAVLYVLLFMINASSFLFLLRAKYLYASVSSNIWPFRLVWILSLRLMFSQLTRIYSVACVIFMVSSGRVLSLHEYLVWYFVRFTAFFFGFLVALLFTMPVMCSMRYLWVALLLYWLFSSFMMTSSNGNIFRVTGHRCTEYTGHQRIPRTKASDAKLWSFL